MLPTVGHEGGRYDLSGVRVEGGKIVAAEFLLEGVVAAPEDN